LTLEPFATAPVTLQSNGISPGHTGKSVRSFWEMSQSRR
jgi:hypothetical protein